MTGKLLFYISCFEFLLFLAFRWIPYECFLVCDSLLELSSLSLESVPSFFPHIIVTQTAAEVYKCTRRPEALAGARRLRNRGGYCWDYQGGLFRFQFPEPRRDSPSSLSYAVHTSFHFGGGFVCVCVYLPYLSIWRVSQYSDWTFNGSTFPPVTQLRSRRLQLF